MPPARLSALFEVKTASTLRISVAAGALISSSLMPLCALLMGEGRLPSGGLAAIYACANGGTASVTRLVSEGGAALSSDRQLQATLAKRDHHTPATLRVLSMRRAYMHAHGRTNGWAHDSEPHRRGGAYYLREVTAIGQREYEWFDLQSVRYVSFPAASTTQGARVHI